MSSKFNMKASKESKQIVYKEKPPIAQDLHTWSTLAIDKNQQKKEKEECNRIKQEYLAKKLSIENKHIQDVDFTDLYEFPFRNSEPASWVYDANDNFIFQFEINNKETKEKCLSIINGDLIPTKENVFIHDGGVIYLQIEEDRIPIILIRGWGNLTGIGAYNLKEEYASKIQDTLAEYIVNKLTIKL